MLFHILLATYKYPDGCEEIKTALVHKSEVETAKDLKNFFINNGHLQNVENQGTVNLHTDVTLDTIYMSV